MEFILKSILVTSFVLVALFGFTIMMSGSAHCLVSLMEGTACPEGLFGFASFHIGFFKNFSSVVSKNLGFLILSLLIGVLFSASKISRKEFIPMSLSFSANEDTHGPFQLIRKLRSWLSLLETSPTSAPAR